MSGVSKQTLEKAFSASLILPNPMPNPFRLALDAPYLVL